MIPATLQVASRLSAVTPVPLPTIDDIRDARKTLDGVSIYTPMEGSRWLSAIAGGPVLIKAENLQRTGSFKIRGAYVRIARLTPEQRAAGVVAASAGNHGQGVALAASLLGARATPCAWLPALAATTPAAFSSSESRDIRR